MSPLLNIKPKQQRVGLRAVVVQRAGRRWTCDAGEANTSISELFDLRKQKNAHPQCGDLSFFLGNSQKFNQPCRAKKCQFPNWRSVIFLKEIRKSLDFPLEMTRSENPKKGH